MSQNTEVQQTVVPQMPTTPEELRNFVIAAVQEILSIPENVIQLSQSIFAAAANVTLVQRERDQREALRPVLTRTYYPGSFRASVALSIDGGAIDVILEYIPVDETEWKDCEPVITASTYEALSKLVLSQPTVPGDVWYITTNAAVNAQLEKVTDLMMGVGEVEAAAEPQPLDLEQVQKDVEKTNESLH